MLSLALALLAQSTPDELSLSWQSNFTESYGEPGSALGVVAGGSRLIAVLGNEVGDAFFLNAYDELGSEAWSLTLEIPPGWSYHDLELSPDAGTAYLLTGLRENNQRVLRLEAFRTTDGVLLWQHDEPFWALDSHFHGDLDASTGRLAVLAALGANSFSLEAARLTVHSTLNGSVLAQSEVISESLERVTLESSGDLAALWNEAGRMDLRDTDTAASLWAVDVATDPGGATGVTELIFDGSATRLVRADGLTTSAYNLSDGSFQWSFDGVDAREVVAYSTDRVFVCGVDGFGSSSGGIQRYAMLDANTGQALWQDFQVEPSGASSVLTVQRWTALSDEPNGRVAFRDRELYVLDAVTGALVGRAELAASGLKGSLGRLDGDRWASLHLLLFGTGGLLCETHSSLGVPDWTLDWEFLLPLNPFLPIVYSAAQGTELHALWMFNPGSFQAPGKGRYEVVDASTGESLRGFYLPQPTYTEGHDVSPDGTRFSVIETPSFGTEVRTVDTFTGLTVGYEEYEEGSGINDRDLVWSPDGSGFAAAWEETFGIVVVKFDSDGKAQWKRTHLGPGADRADQPRLAWDPVTGDLLLAHTARLATNFEWVFGAAIFSSQSGATLASALWEDGPEVDAFGFEPVALDIDPVARRAHVVLGSEVDNDDQIQVLSFDLEPLEISGESLTLPIDTWTQAFPKGVSFTADHSRVAVATPGAIEGGVNGLLIHSVDLDTLSLELTAEFDSSILQAQIVIQHLSDQLLSLVGGDVFGEQEVILLDAQTLAPVETLPAEGIFPQLSSTVPLVADAGWSLAALGFASPNSLELHLQRWDAGALLGSPNELPVAGGDVEFLVGAGIERANQLFMLMGSASGTDPGFAIDGVQVPLTFDPYTRDSIVLAGSGPFAESLGVLDDQGEGRARLSLPNLDPALVGLTAHHAAVTFGAGLAADFATQPVPLTVIP